MRNCLTLAVFVCVCAAVPVPAAAQRFPFERSFDATAPATLDVSTVRGGIVISAGERGRIVVAGTVTVRVGWDAPANAVELSKQVAAAPPMTREGDTLRLRVPSDPTLRRAMTISYDVRVPPDTIVRTTSESGAIRVRGVGGAVDIRTQSSAIDVSGLGGSAAVATGSGAVTIDQVAGALTVATASSAIRAGGIGGSMRVRTQSGDVQVDLAGSGDVDVQTGSSAIRLRGVRGGLNARTQSGHVSVQGVPGRPWSTTTDSSSVELELGAGAGFAIDARTRSSSVNVEPAPTGGSVSKAMVTGAVNGGGPLVQVSTGNGSIRVRSAVR